MGEVVVQVFSSGWQIEKVTHSQTDILITP